MPNAINYKRTGSNGPECTFSWANTGVEFSAEQQQELAEALARRPDVNSVAITSTSVSATRTVKNWQCAESFEHIMSTIVRISGNKLMTTRDANRTYE